MNEEQSALLNAAFAEGVATAHIMQALVWTLVQKGLLSIEEIRVMFDSALAAMENASEQAGEIGDASAMAWTSARRSIERHMRAAIRPPLDDSP
jgi:hypothetical protein